MTDDDHQALLKQIVARNSASENAMAQLYRALSGQVFAFVRNRLSAADDHAVHAVVQEVLYEVWRAAPHFSGASLVKTWVLGIARHKLLDAARQNRRSYLQDDIADHAETLPDESADVVNLLAEKQRAEWLTFCMDKLPADQRESLHLLLVEAMSVQAIADIQGCPGGTVKTRVFHAKAKLKNCLARWLRHDGDTPGEPDFKGSAA
ncbi:MAG: RNA polymerase sigma factor [Pseudomonadota bacterium]